tara:strand:- start:2727 stop:3833 length:1107 start_codon:yes stop_codon:yes gene_type:complete
VDLDLLNNFDPLSYRGEPTALFDLSFVKDAIRDLRLKPKNKVILTRGTNGKTSTCFFLDSIVRKNNLSSICFTSPHIHAPNERILLNGANLPMEDFFYYEQRISLYEDQRCERKFTYFEAVFLICLFVNVENNADYLILEAGLGGPKDATAAVDFDLLVLTSIGLDHQSFLGDTKEQILESKLLDVEDTQIITFAENKKYGYLNSKNVKYVEVSDCGSEFLSKNKNLAENAAEHLGLQRKKSNQTIKGRLQVLRKKPLLILDGAHNPEGLHYLCEHVEKFKIRKALLGMKNGKLKDCRYVIDKFGFEKIAWCDLPEPWRSDAPLDHWTHLKTDSEILEWILADEDCIVFGSLYLASKILKMLKRRKVK